MNALIDAAFARQRTVLTTLFAIILFGISAYLTIPKEADPDIPIPFVYVQVPHPGISPEDADRLIVKPMEAKLRSIEGLEEIRSVASEGHVGIILEFDVSFDPETALSDVREQVDLAKPDLPDDSEEPTVMEFNTSIFPIMIVVLSGSAPERYLLRHAQLLQDELEAIPSVLGARLVGQREELLEVIVDPAKLESYNISQTELINAVTLNNRLVAAGALDTGAGRFSVKVPGLFETAADVMQLPVKTDGESVVTLSDITEIRRTFKDADAYAQLDGEASIAIAVTKRIGHNILTTADQVRQTVDNYRTDLPPSMKIDYGADASKWVLGMLSSLESAVITAIALVMIVVLAALGLRSAMLVGISIPTSFLIGFTLLGVTGVTVNMMVMFGMILAVGILVDGAIVVVEFADRKMAEGAPRDQAYRLAAKRMFWPIVSSTATTLAAFVPMLFWPGVSGKFMSYLPITLIFVLVGSLLMALI
ncbi:MAG TPA: transporter, partial [Alphaproteobacteria bacterium]|nr:transporter [Alphaproteobacteria bacterium]